MNARVASLTPGKTSGQEPELQRRPGGGVVDRLTEERDRKSLAVQ